jgi:BlaI family penicillinase repressor
MVVTFITLNRCL